ncbi:hypothetical protein B5F83_09175 [Muribaculum sp. An289]|nr:hypothetical protein B5F83_09175 [Muribaculum sp. An289]OUO39931.1 hypothetical protein B5F81_10370 [Muribaculum sp. An287]
MTTVDVVCYKYKPLKNGELPLKIKVCKDRKTRYINLGVSTKPENWDFENNRPKETCPDKEMLESLISKNISEVRSKIVELKKRTLLENYLQASARLLREIMNTPHGSSGSHLLYHRIQPVCIYPLC